MPPVSLKSAIDPDLLISLIELEEFGEAVDSIKSLSNEALLEWLQLQDEATLESVNLVKNNVRISLYEPDLKLRGIKLISDYKTLLRLKNWDGIISENTKVATQHIVNQRCFMVECEGCTPEEGKELLEQYIEKKRKERQERQERETRKRKMTDPPKESNHLVSIIPVKLVLALQVSEDCWGIKSKTISMEITVLIMLQLARNS